MESSDIGWTWLVEKHKMTGHLAFAPNTNAHLHVEVSRHVLKKRLLLEEAGTEIGT